MWSLSLVCDVLFEACQLWYQLVCLYCAHSIPSLQYHAPLNPFAPVPCSTQPLRTSTILHSTPSHQYHAPLNPFTLMLTLAITDHSSYILHMHTLTCTTPSRSLCHTVHILLLVLYTGNTKASLTHEMFEHTG